MKYTEWFVKHKLEKKLSWLNNNVLLETIMGSHAYGCENPNSDYDVYTIVMPRREHLWPQRYGYILHLDDIPNFRRHQLKGEDRTTIERKEVEIEWISIVEFIKLAGLQCSPNLVEVLFARRNLITAGSKVGWMLRDKRNLFLSAKAFQTFKHYAHRQMHIIRSKNPVSTERKTVIEQHGYDIKMGYHVLRLLDILEQMLTNNDIDLMRNREECKTMKSGSWGDLNRLEQTFQTRIDGLESLFRSTGLPQQPQADALHNLLLEIIEDYYGSEEKAKRDIEFVSAEDVMKELVEHREILEGLRNDTK